MKQNFRITAKLWDRLAWIGPIVTLIVLTEFLVMPVWQKKQETQVKLDRLSVQVYSNEKLDSLENQLHKQINAMKAVRESFGKKLQTEITNQTSLSRIRKLAEQKGLKVHRIDPSISKGASLNKLKIKLAVDGTYPKLMNFFKSVYAENHDLYLEEVRLQKKGNRLKANMTVYLYWTGKA